MKESYDEFMERHKFPTHWRFEDSYEEQCIDFCKAVTQMIKESGLRDEFTSKSKLIYNLIQNARNLR